MSASIEDNVLCERCSLLSFDDFAIGGREAVNEDGVARLSFLESQIELRPSYFAENPDDNPGSPDYRLVRLEWNLDDSLPDMPHLSLSSQRGCTFCQTLRSSLEEAFAEEAKYYHVHAGPLHLVAFLALADEGIEGLVIEGDFNYSVNGTGDDIQTFFPVEVDSKCEKWLGAQPTRADSYLDPDNIRKICHLLDHCTSTCHPGVPSSFMPTRLIDVGVEADTVPRVVFSSDIRKSEDTKYTALSYCWGSEEDALSQFKTEIASLEHRCVGLPYELMTQTTKDAIALTRAIGIHYIWIDALCIVQDDVKDWVHESSLMSLIYRHAFATFCSLNSDSCHESFLTRTPAVKIPFQSTIRKEVNGHYLIRRRSRTGCWLDREKYASDSALARWSERCWTYQEQELSTRLILFGSSRMHFACARSKWSEGDDAPMDKFEPGILDQITACREGRISRKKLYECWGSVIHEYGYRSVTSDKDRLPAIAGLARLVGEALQDQYLAGLWKGHLLPGLNWHATGDMLSRGLETHMRHILQRSYVAPSWSWASCPAVGAGNSTTPVVGESHIVEANVESAFGDLYGQLIGGSLRIHGKMAKMPTWLPNDKGNRWSSSWLHEMEGSSDDDIFVSTDWLHKKQKEDWRCSL